MTGWFQERWSAFWFDHASALNLAMLRILLATQALWVLLSRDYAGISELPEVFWSQVGPGASWRYLIFPGHPGIESLLQWAAIGAVVAALLGFHARVACLVAGLLLYHLAPMEVIIWTEEPYARGLTLPVLGLVLLSFSRCDDRLAIRHPRARSGLDPRLAHSWQLRLFQLVLSQVYLFSGWSKIVQSGFGWASSQNLRRWLLYMSQDPTFAVFQGPGQWLAAHPVLISIISVGTLIFEFGFISVMFSKTAKRVLVPMAMAFHIGILFALNTTFITQLLLLAFVNWDWVESRIEGRWPRVNPATLPLRVE